MLHSWKFAANGVWEQALLVDAKQPDLSVISQWVLQQAQNVALEAIFAENGQPATMYGIRITSLSKAEQTLRIKAIVGKSDQIKSEADFRRFAIEIFPEFPLFGHLAALNIGIVSQWYSIGPETIWKLGKEPLGLEALETKAPRFFGKTQNPAAIEFWYTQPTDHWYKIYVSDVCEDGYVIDPDKYRAAIGRLSEFTNLTL